MPTTIPEDIRRKMEADLIAMKGLTPGEARLEFDENGGASLVPTGAHDKGWLSTVGRLAGQRAIGGLATVPAGLATAAAAEPLIQGAAAAASPTVIGAPAVEIGGHALAFMGGQMAAQAALDKSGASDQILKMFGDTPAQIEFDRANRPWASAAGDLLGSAASFQVNPRTIGKNLWALGTTLAARKFKDAAAKEAVKMLTRNVAGNVGITTAQQLVHDGELDPKGLAQSAVEGVVLGKPRAAHQWMADKIVGTGKRWFTGAPVSSPSGVSPEGTAPPVISTVESAVMEDPISAAAAQSIAAQKAGKLYVPRYAGKTTADVAPELPAVAVPIPRPTPVIDPQDVRNAQMKVAQEQLRDQQAADLAPEQRPLIFPQRTALPNPPAARPPQPYFKKQLAEEVGKLPGRFQQPDFSGFDPNAMTLEEYIARQRKPSSFNAAADAPTPEPAAVLDEAARAAADPATTKAAALVPEGSPTMAAPPGMKLVRVPQGVLLVNPTKVPPGEPMLTPDGQVRGTLLGLSQESKPATPAAAVVTDKPGAPAVLTEVTDGTPEANARAAAAQRRAVPGGTQRVTTPDEVVATRAEALAAEQDQTAPRRGATPDSITTGGAGRQPRETTILARVEPATHTPAAMPPAEAGGGAPPTPKPAKPDGLGAAAAFEPVPMSIVDRAFRMSPETGKALADYHSATQAIYGRHFNTLLDQLRHVPREVVNAALNKRLTAYKTKMPPVFTAEEAKVNAAYDAVMRATAAEATAAGYPIKVEDYYVPQIFNEATARRVEAEGDRFLAAELPKFQQHNAAIVPGYDPVEGAAYARDYLQGVGKSPNSLGSEFGALTKYKRQYHLLPEWIEPDFLRGLQRYGQRFASQVAYKQFIESNPEAYRHLYGAESLDRMTEPMRNARMGVEGVLFNEGRNSSGVGQSAKDLMAAGQQVAYSGAMQTATGLANTVQKAALHMGMAAQTEGGFKNLTEATFRTVDEWHTQREKAVRSGLVRPGYDPNIIADSTGPIMETARTLRAFGQKLRFATGGEFLETMNRVHDFTIGEGLARINVRLLASGDPAAVQFVNRFGAGVTKGMPHEEQVMRMARNYAEAVQSSYSMVGLPAPMLKGGVVGQLTRIQRFGWENMMRTHQYVLKPAIEKGDFGPLVAYLFGAAVTAPILAKLRQLFSGRPSGIPTNAEIEASGRNPLWQYTLDAMQTAQLTGAFGTAGSAAGAVASNIRGGHQSLTGDPALSFAVSLMNNAGHAAEAVRQGEPAVPVLMELGKRTLVQNMQVLRRFGQEPGEAEDRRNKAVYEYLMEKKQTPIGDMINSLALGGVSPSRTPEISPTKEAARNGDAVALQKLTPQQRTALDNYPGGYEDAVREAQYQRWLQTTQSPESLAAYQARRQAYKSRRAAGRP